MTAAGVGLKTFLAGFLYLTIPLHGGEPRLTVRYCEPQIPSAPAFDTDLARVARQSEIDNCDLAARSFRIVLH